MEVLSFDDALQKAGDKRHLLLGNGFSIALFPDIFRYGSLFKKAKFSDFPEIISTFKALETEDFEVAVQSLEGAALLLPHFSSNLQDTSERMKDCAQKIKEVLVQTIAGQHPDRPGCITNEQYAACISFLGHFLNPTSKGKIYTLNYDILLYWVLMHGLEQKKFGFNDGFEGDPDNAQAEYVIWGNAPHGQDVYYLHGALHLFDGGHELQKYSWKRTDIALIDQTREAINKNYFPLFVSEGTAHKKLGKIMHHAYLSKGLRSLGEIHHSVFIHGVSFSNNDEHILNIIGKNKNLKNIFVGLHGTADSIENTRIINKAKSISQTKHRNKTPVGVHFYDSASANVWS